MKKKSGAASRDQSLYDLVLLVADSDAREFFEGLLSKPTRLGIRSLARERWHIHPDPMHDPSVYRNAHETLRQYCGKADHAIVVLDKAADFGGKPDAEEIKATIRDNLERNGWSSEAVEVVVIDPEVEVWLWGGGDRLAAELGWNDEAGLRRELKLTGGGKPQDPKATYREALRRARKRASPALFRTIASKMSGGAIKACQDPAFNQLKSTLQRWFPPTK